MIKNKAIMKKYCLVISAAILSVFALSCSKETKIEELPQPGEEQGVVTPSDQIPEGYVRLSFDADAESTRTSISNGVGDERVVSWVIGDKVRVSYDGGSVYTNAQEAGEHSKFTVDVPAGKENLYFSYPYETAVNLAGSTLSVTIPAEQDGAFANANYLVAAALASDEAIHFYNAGALFKIVLSDATITKAVITGNSGEALVGTVPFTFSGSGVTPGVPTSTGTTLTVNFSGTGTYYVSALPDLSLADGATIRFYRGTAPAGAARWSGAKTVNRAEIASWGDSDAITNRYVKTGAASGKNGRSWENAWGVDELKAFLTNSAARTAEQLDLMNGITVKVAAGTYVMAASAGDNTQLDWSVHASPLTVSFVGGYPAAGGATPDPSTNETILSGDDKGCVLWVYQDSNLSFNGFTFSHGSTSSGGRAAVVFSNAGTASLVNCKFENNVNTATAGALTFNGGGTFTATDCIFSSNQGANAGGFNMDNAGTNATLTNCVFNENVATNGNGGAFKVTTGTATLTGCTFTDNHSSSHGGALWIAEGTAELTDCIFKGNYSLWGGAIYSNKAGSTAPSSTFTSCTFGGSGSGEANYADDKSGGAVACDAGTMHFNGCSFVSNTATSDRGGVFFFTNSESKLYIGEEAVANSGGSFTGNSASNGGVIAIQSGANAWIYNAEFDSNSASSHGGVLTVTGGSPVVHFGGNDFHDNSAGSAGGVVAVKGSGTASTPNHPEIYVDNGNSFTDNSAPSGGGAIKLRDEPVKVTDGETAGNETAACLYISGANTFTGNHTASGYGGCLDLRTSGTVEISGATFNGNYTANNADSAKGGAINLSDSSIGTGNFTISNCVFDGNYTSGTDKAAVGGAINIGGNDSNWAMSAKIYKCLFKDNKGKQGGAISCYDASAKTWISDCAFTGNHIANNYGTTISTFNGAELCINNCSFADDTYTKSGNGQQSCWINFKSNGIFVMSNCTLIGTTRNESGAVTSTNPNLLRMDGARAGAKTLINNIIAPTGSCNAMDAQSNTITAKYNKHGAILNNGNYNGSGTESAGYLGTSTYFGNLAWSSAGSASWNNRYWGWNGTLSGGDDTTMASLDDVKAAITEAKSDFAAWLTSIGSFDKDGRGHTRGATTWPGAYDATND